MKTEASGFAGKVTDTIWWWLGKRRKFNLNDEYSIELLHIDRDNESVKIRITNLKTQVEQVLTHE